MSETAFCCAGCEAVYQLIHAKGLNPFYEIRDREKSTSAPVKQSWINRDWSTLDQAETMALLTTDNRTLKFHVEDLNCSACVWILERLQTASDQIEWSSLDFGRGILTVRRKPEASFAAIAHTIASLGFRADPIALDSSWQTLRKKTERRELIRVGILGALTGNIMLLSVPLYGGADGSIATVFRWGMAAIALPIVTWGAYPLYLNSFRALKARRISLDLPVALAIVAATVVGFVGLMRGLDTLFFDSTAMLVFLIQSSRTFLMFLKNRSQAAETSPHWILQSVRDAETKKNLPATAILKGTRFSISAGQCSPVDALIGTVSTEWDLAVLTGESEPFYPLFGAVVPAGARLLSASATLESLSGIYDSRIFRLLGDWREGPRRRQGLTELSDRVGQIFTAVVLIIAGTLVFMDFESGPSGWLRALALLVVTCPCVFGVAIPLAEALAMEKAASRGLLVRESSFFERLRKIQKVFIDKTGTLTTGKMNLRDVSVSGINEQEAFSLALAIEGDDLHPVARAIASAATTRGLRASSKITSTEAMATGGRKASGDELIYEMNSIPSRGATTDIQLVANGQRIAVFALGDELKKSAREFIRFLATRVRDIEVISGDRSEATARLAEQLNETNISCSSGLSPIEKAAKLIHAGQTQKTMMIGDGANDAEALRNAYVSIAIKGDFATCLEAADAVLTTESLKPIETAFEIADRLNHVLIASLCFAGSFNIIAGTLAVRGTMSPLIAAILMPISSVVVTAIAWTGLKGFRVLNKEVSK